MRWEEFIITLGPLDATGNCSISSQSPLGEVQSSISRKALEDGLGPVAADPGTSRSSLSRDAVPRPAPRPSPRTTGTVLFETLFTNQSKELFHVTEGFVMATGRGLRIVFKINLDGNGGPWLQGVPWELLYQQSKREFVALMDNRSIVRHLEILQPLAEAALPAALRLLAVASLPDGVQPLDLAAEKGHLQAAWPGGRLRLLDNPTLDQVADEIQTTGPYDAFHFMGHARFDSDKGNLLLSKGDGGIDFVDGPRLRVALGAPQNDLRLVFLNACRTADVGPGLQSDPFAGLAAAVTMQGVPAVIAMRERIADRAAIDFSKVVHHELAAVRTLDEAVLGGRRSLRIPANEESDEWSQPILFLRSRPHTHDVWSRLYMGILKLPAALRRIGTWGGALCGFLLGLLALALLAILQGVAPSEMSWLASLGLLALTTATGTLLARGRFAYDVRVLALSAALILTLTAVRPLVPTRIDIPIANVGNLSGWMADTHPPDRWIDFAMVQGGCRSASCLRFDYHPGGGWAGIYWIPWQCDDGNVAGRDCSIDLLAGEASRIRRLSFFARGERGGEIVGFQVGGDDFAPAPVKLSNVTLSKDWQRYTIPLEGVDLTSTVGLFAWFAADAFNSDDTTFYLDEIVFEGVSCPLDRQ